MKTNILKTGIAIIIAFACSYSLICMNKSSDNCQLSDDYQTSKNSLDKSSDDCQSSDDYQISKNSLDKSSDDCQSSDDYQISKNSLDKSSDNCQLSDDYLTTQVTTDSGWVQKDGYLENALQVGSISYFRYSNDGQYLFTFGEDYTFRKWDVKTGMVVKEKWFEDVYNLAFDMNNDEVTFAILNSTNFGNLVFYKNDSIISQTNFLNFYNKPDYCRYNNITLCFCKNTKEIHINFDCSCTSNGEGYSIGANASWDYEKNILIRREISYGNATNMLLSNDGKYILFSCFGYHYINEENNYTYFLGMRNLDNNNVLQIEKGNNSYSHHSLAFSNDSRYLTATLGNLYTLCWDIELQKMKYTIKSHFLKNTKFSIDDRFLIATIEKKDNSIIKFFLAETGVEADSIYLASKSHYGLIAVSSDSINIAIAGNDGRLRIFQPKIFNKKYFASFTSDTLIKQLGEPIYFTDNSFNNPTSWHWDFGDGTTSTEQHPVHYYQTKGLFSVKLIASNGFLKDTLTRKDFIRIQIPVVANFDSNITQDTVPLNVQFINQSQGDIKNYSWNFGYNKTSNEENPSILYDKWGEFDVSLKVTDGYFSDSILVSEKIKVIPPAIPFFTNKLEKRFVQNNQSYYGIDGLQTFDGNFAFIANVFNVLVSFDGYEYSYKEKYRNKMLIKMDSIGNVIWEKIVTKGKKIAQLLDSCLIIVDDSVTSRNEIYVAKYNQDGEFLWERFHRTQTLNSDSPTNIKATRDSGYVIAADSKYYDEYRSSIFKTNKNGIQTMYKANLNGRYTDVIEIEDGYYFLIYHNPNNKNIMISKINNSGKVLASVICGDKNNIFPKNTILTQKSNLIIAGWLTNTDNMQYSYMLKVDSLGNKLWDLIGTTPNSCYYYISSIADTLFAASGNFNNQLGVDIINNQGELVNSVRFPERNGVINSIITTKDNDLFLTGSITPPYKFSQLYTLLLKHPYIITSVEDEHTENTANPELPFSIFPNPTNSTATLQYKIETPTNVKIELIDFMGLKVSELENTYKEAGEYNSLINFEKLTIAKGIYFVRFIANGNVFICKLVYV